MHKLPLFLVPPGQMLPEIDLAGKDDAVDIAIQLAHPKMLEMFLQAVRHVSSESFTPT